MNNIFKTLIAGAAARKFGGGCLGSILVFALVWVVLGQCSNSTPFRESAKPVDKVIEVTTDFSQNTFTESCYRVAS